MYIYIKPPPTKKGTPWAYGQILKQPTDRSYEISTPTNIVRRNRIHIRPAAPPNIPLYKPIIIATHVPTILNELESDHITVDESTKVISENKAQNSNNNECNSNTNISNTKRDLKDQREKGKHKHLQYKKRLVKDQREKGKHKHLQYKKRLGKDQREKGKHKHLQYKKRLVKDQREKGKHQKGMRNRR